MPKLFYLLLLVVLMSCVDQNTSSKEFENCLACLDSLSSIPTNSKILFHNKAQIVANIDAVILPLYGKKMQDFTNASENLPENYWREKINEIDFSDNNRPEEIQVALQYAMFSKVFGKIVFDYELLEVTEVIFDKDSTKLPDIYGHRHNDHNTNIYSAKVRGDFCFSIGETVKKFSVMDDVEIWTSSKLKIGTY